ncbi:methyltransferase domain-containing protein [Saccharopolyspora sp. K220]|uniref:methyltransferase domain-containing protein n=1 Tax=Saccharopolyspora soli TaxID=2926618 RepID=UPI001F58EFDF|nr:methyltransferase domain-containing protein [Saccharopolyspora soli]MCI2416260.1 methyltransferase domain-containing protein [Saccharopolyspora soli]
MSTANLIQVLDRFGALPEATRLRERSYDLLTSIGPVLDVGCGVGTAVAELRKRGVPAIGMDVDEEMIATATDRYPDADFRVGDACALPFADGELSGYRAEKVYHAVADPDRALAEARRVLAPGGRIVLLGQDWEAILIDADDMATTRTAVQARTDTMPNPHSARRYRNLLLNNGFQDVTMEVHTGLLTGDLALPVLLGLAEVARAAGAITADQAEAWTTEQRHRAETDRLFCAIPIFVAAATNP